MFGFDPVHTPQLELSVKGDSRKGIAVQRTITVANAFDWVDTNGDGLADSWTISGGTPSIITGGGFPGRAQRLDATGTNRTLRTTSTVMVVKGEYYRIRFKWRSGNMNFRLGGVNYISLGSNTGSAIAYDGIHYADANGSIQFLAATSDFVEIDEVELWEIDVARLWDESQNRINHGVLFSGRGFTFDGVSTYIDCGNNSSLQITAQLSIAFWIKSATNSKVILSKDDTGSNRAFQIYKDSSGKLNFITVSGATVSTTVESTASIDDNRWHRVVCTYTGSAKNMYVDGTLITTQSVSGAINNASVNLFMGKLGNNTSYLSGSLSDVQIWDKAFDSDDVLYDLQYPEKVASKRPGTSLAASDLKGHWWLSENNGYYAYDYSGNANNGLLQGVTAIIQQKDIPQQTLINRNEKTFCKSGVSLRVLDSTPIRNIWNGGGKASMQILPFSDGESDIGTVIEKTRWQLRCEGQSAGKIKLRFIMNFSTTNGEWVTTNTEVSLNTISTIELEYNCASTANNPVIKVNGSSVTLTKIATPAGTFVSDNASYLYVGNANGLTTAFDGFINSLQVYNSSVLKGAWINEGSNRWFDTSGNNNPVLAPGSNLQAFFAEDPNQPSYDVLGFPLINLVKRFGLNFDITSYYECGRSNSLTFNAATDDFSISFWMLRARPGSASTEVVVNMQESTTSGYGIIIDTSDRIQMTFNALTTLSSTTITDKNWHFLVFTIDRDDTIRIYLDGTEVSYTTQDPLASATLNSLVNLRAGARAYTSGTNLFKGQLAGLTLHRKLLDVNEQKHLYAFGESHYS